MLGPVVLDVQGHDLQEDDLRRLNHPCCGGVILFSRNFESIEQLKDLCFKIKSLRSPSLLVAVDHEGGRVQRFKTGFTALPAMRLLGEQWEHNSQDHAKVLSEDVGIIISTELSSCGIDLSFTPVLDLDYERSSVIGNRAFHSVPEVVTDLSSSLIRGLHKGGFSAVGKHFPGHGYVKEDSHAEIVRDRRTLDSIYDLDLMPFVRHFKIGLDAIMPAHVIFPKIDKRPVGFSEVWLQKILREELEFQGIVFSDDLSMHGASVIGSIEERAEVALEAGCDAVIVCNDSDSTDKILHHLDNTLEVGSSHFGKLEAVRSKKQAIELIGGLKSAVYREAVRRVNTIVLQTN